MHTVPDLLARLEADPDREDWLEQAETVMFKITERYRPGGAAFNLLAYERDAEALDRLIELVREYRRRQQSTEDHGGRS